MESSRGTNHSINFCYVKPAKEKSDFLRKYLQLQMTANYVHLKTNRIEIKHRYYVYYNV